MSSPAAGAPSRPAYRRRLHYVDRSIQRSLLVAMVALEVTLVVASTWLAYWYLNGLIEAGLYRVHIVQSGPTLTRLMEEGFTVLGLFAVVNLIALMIAGGIWSYRENLVLQDFTRLVEKTRELDYSGDPEPRRQHEVLALVVAWRERERSRFAAIRNQVEKLEAAVSAEASPQDLRDAVERLSKLLS